MPARRNRLSPRDSNQLASGVPGAVHSIAKYFKTGFGLRAQFIDLQIAERVLLHFAKHDIPCLPIHDSFIMHHGYESELEDQMLMAFEEATGQEGAIKAERRDEREPGIYIVPSELDEIFDVGAMGRLGNPQKSAILGSTKPKV